MSSKATLTRCAFILASEEQYLIIAQKLAESKIGRLDHYTWKSHCHGLFEMPEAA